MRRLAAMLFLMLSPTLLVADIPSDGAVTFTSDTKTVVNVSTTTTSPTQLCTRDSYLTRTWIVNLSTFTLLISTSSSNLTSTSFGIPPSGTAGFPGTPFSPDGPTVPYWGSIFGVLTGSSATSANGNNVGVLRTK